MKDIRIKDLVTFRRLTEKRQSTFINNLQKEKIAKEKEEGSGGDYWVRSISALNNAFRENDNRFISDKITDIINDYNPKLDKGTKVKYDRNLQILYNYEDFDFRSVTPAEEIEILSKARKSGVIEIAALSLKVETHHIYTFSIDEKEYLGALLFAAQKEGYQPSELGIFAEAIFNFLDANYGSKYIIHPSFVKVVGVMTHGIVDYQMVLDGDLPSIILPIIENIKNLNNNI
ncbi:hypothetical protein [Chryseobacterium sp. JAH]|uniref:hypothetical protein n=1 Tax=Chryseobacterium sp. JAH TaxID=1742858 RepID=UPI000740DC61|nr:hypothetical protein [Chryseobacterium sp. JAH]KUJ50915.1 hypothetical protein AR685_11810 [Chryseobacterium sp. JAH]